MNIFDWKCTCGKDSSTLDRFEELIPYTDKRMHRPELCTNPVCECGKPLIPFGPESDKYDLPRPLNAIFDYVFQVWRQKDGTAIAELAEWNSSCPKCLGPAHMENFDSYNEYHKCLNCNHEFKVN